MRAICNTGSETVMRQELAEAVRKLVEDVDPDLEINLTEDETGRILRAANLVTLARTAVEYDHRGEVTEAHAPEMPTRFAKQLTQLMRGGIAIGMTRYDALALAIRCARDSIPPLRLQILQDLTENPESQSLNIARRINKPKSTVRRQAEALHLLGVLTARIELKEDRDKSFYRLASVSLDSLLVPKMSDIHIEKNNKVHTVTDKSGLNGASRFDDLGARP